MHSLNGRTLGQTAVLLAVLACAACGRPGAAYITLEVPSDKAGLSIPDDVNKISMKVSDSANGAELLTKEYSLSQGQYFPMTLGLEAGGFKGSSALFEATAFKDTTRVAGAQVTVPFVEGELSSVTIRLLFEP